jgi:tetratricopeptide (TPR) repeat protein
MKNRFYQYILGVIFVMLFFPASSSAESSRSLVEEGNKAFAQEDYGASWEHYNKAAEMEPESAIVMFNMGDALYKQEKFAEAFNAFEQAAAKALQNNDRMLEARSRYNMGNSSFRKAEKLLQENPEMALAEYKRSSEYYQAAVKLDPDFTDAAHNLEASRIAARQIEEVIRQQKQEAQQQEQQKKDIAEKLENLQQEQQDAAEQTNKLDQSRQQEGAKGETAEQEGQLAENQEDITERTRNTNEELDELSQGKRSEESAETAQHHINKAVEKQQEAEKKLEQERLSEAHEDQLAASRELQEALKQLEQDQKNRQEQEESGGKEQESAPKQAAAQQEQQEQESQADNAGQQEEQVSESTTHGDVSPEDIINEELENKKYRSARGGTGYEPVDKDW